MGRGQVGKRYLVGLAGMFRLEVWGPEVEPEQALDVGG